MLYSQPLATRFGTDLVSHIKSGLWNKLDIAVAWVRVSGLNHLRPALEAYLKSGNEFNIVVGVDLDNTTKEGLEGLLSLQAFGRASTVVHHNESGTIFHPKLYLFRNATRTKLIVGSNNLTEAGLFLNTEVGMEIDVDIGDSVIASAVNALDAWRDTSLGLAKSLDATFLGQLIANGYLKDEAMLRAEFAARRATALPKGLRKTKLFGSVAVTPPVRPLVHGGASTKSPASRSPKKAGVVSKTSAGSGSSTVSTSGQVLLMRVRKARGTQVQIPKAVMRTPFFKGVTHVTSVSTAIIRGIHATHASRDSSGNTNTLKLEMPETRTIADPVVRFEMTGSGIQYEVYDSTSSKGKAIMQALKLGLRTNPIQTTLTKPSAPQSSTWWRFI